MTKQEQINNWLTSAFNAASGGGISEFFYYDRRDNEFFSILVIDYFRVDENFNVGKGVEVGYSEKTLNLLTERMKRINREDQSILSIPLADSKSPLQSQIDSFLNLNAIDTSTATIWETEDTSITIKVDKPWWKFW